MSKSANLLKFHKALSDRVSVTQILPTPPLERGIAPTYRTDDGKGYSMREWGYQQMPIAYYPPSAVVEEVDLGTVPGTTRGMGLYTNKGTWDSISGR